MPPILYSFRRCPYAMRARLALLAADMAYERQEVSLKNKPAKMLEYSPKGTVPVLILPNETVIDESLDIMRWALSKQDLQGWLNGFGLEGDALIKRNDGLFKYHLDRYKYPMRYAESAQGTSRDQCAVVLEDLNRLLTVQPFLSGAQWGFVDAALAPFVRQCAHVDDAWFLTQPWPKLIDWLNRFEASPAFAAIMQR